MRACFLLCAAVSLSAQAPPATRTDSVTEVIHGVKIADPYRWLEDQTSPQTRAWIEQQNAYARSLLDKIPDREAIRKRLSELMRFDDTRTPVPAGGRTFFLRRAADQEQATLYVREGGKDPQQDALKLEQILSQERRRQGITKFTEEQGP